MIPELPAADRDVYIRQVSGAVGLAALTATVVRVAPSLLLNLCSTEAGKAEPILGQLGKLERRVLWQLSLAENWKRDQDAAKEAAKGTSMLPPPESTAPVWRSSLNVLRIGLHSSLAMSSIGPQASALSCQSKCPYGAMLSLQLNSHGATYAFT